MAVLEESAYSTPTPEVALVNNIAAAHLERMGSLVGVAETKGAIYAVLPIEGVAVVIEKAVGTKCARSWKISPEVGDVDHRRCLERGADAFGSAFQLQSAGHDAADIANRLPLFRQLAVTVLLQESREQCEVHRGLRIGPEELPRFLRGERQCRREPLQNRVAKTIDHRQRRLARIR